MMTKTTLLLISFFFNGFAQSYLYTTGVGHADQRSSCRRPLGDHCMILTKMASSSNDEYDGDENPFAEQRRRILENAKPKLPSGGKPPSKADVYEETELQGLWEIHKQLSSQTQSTNEEKAESPFNEMGIPSIHDLVMETVDQVNEDAQFKDESTDSKDQSHYSWMTDEIKDRARKIIAIASDVDGTLIGSDQQVNERTKTAVQKAIQSAFSPMGKLQWFFPATGKTRAGAINSLGPELAPLVQSCPGVFIQGLYCVIGDTVIFEKKLDPKAVVACEKLVKESGTSIIAYDADSLYTTDLTQTVVNLHELYGEPLSKEIPSIADYAGGVHKILICDEDIEKLVNIVRPQLEAVAAENNACVTQAVPTMLELIPEGCSKALGVEKLCEKLGINPGTDLLALGDAENDAGMLQMAAIGVVMGNGSPPARKAGDIILDETSDEGGAGIAIETIAAL